MPLLLCLTLQIFDTGRFHVLEESVPSWRFISVALAADVQPFYIAYAHLWTYQAFDIRLEKGWFHGRGVDDAKGDLLMMIHVSHGPCLVKLALYNMHKHAALRISAD